MGGQDRRGGMKSMGVGQAAPAKRPTWARTLFFAALLLLSLGTCGLSFTFLPRILEEPHLFALVFSLGSVAAVSAFALRTGPARFLRSRLSRSERPFTAIYLVALLGTLHGAASQYYLSSVCFAAAQFAVFMCRLEGLISLEHGRHDHSGGVAYARAGRPRWKTLLRTPHIHDPYSVKFESLDYDDVTSDLARTEEGPGGRNGYTSGEAAVGRWLLTAACGIAIGLVAFFMEMLIEEISHWKMLQVTSRIKVEFMMETGGQEDVPLWNATHKVTEHLIEALDFEYDAYCAKIESRELCGGLTDGDRHCYWDDEEENRDGSCDEDAPCCVEKEGSPVIFFFCCNLFLALLACLPVVLFAPEAAGSGIPEVMGYLNGVHIRRLLKTRTLLAKMWGTVLAVSAGFVVGPGECSNGAVPSTLSDQPFPSTEGPLIHSGAIIGSMLTRGHRACARKKTASSKPRGRRKDLSIFTLFNNDIDRRDFISMGAAAGFAAAFGAPVGGVLFALEEASSFWNTKLMWRLLLCTSLASFTLSFCRNFEEHAEGKDFRFQPGMLSFKSNSVIRFKHQWELLLCCVLGALTGVLGAVFNKLVASLAAFRPRPAQSIVFDDDREWVDTFREIGRLLQQHSFRIGEVLTISVLTSALTFGLPWIGAWYGFACQVESDEIAATENVTGFNFETYPFYCETTWDAGKGRFCAERGCKQYNDMATIFLSSRENSILSLVEHPQAFSARSLALISVSFFMLMVFSFGAAFPGGIFMPTIVVGCTFGALFGRCAKYVSCVLDQVDGGCMAHNPFGQSEHGGSGLRLDDVGFSPHLDNVIEHTGPYALLGAVGLLGGIQRSSVSLVVIIVEGTGKVDYLLPIIFTTVCAKWVGDKFNAGIYHTMHRVKGIPFLENEPERGLQRLSAQDLMHKEPVVIQSAVRVREIRDLLHTVNRPLFVQLHAFPVVKDVAVQIGGEDRVLKVYRGVILVEGLCALLRAKRFYERRDPGGELIRVGAAGDDRALNGGAIGGEGEAGGDSETSSGEDEDDAEDEEQRAMELEMEAEPTGRLRFAMMTLAALKKRSTHKLHVEEALLRLEESDLDLWLDVEEAMNQAPFHVLTNTPAHKVHRLFRTMGLRHLVVTDELNQVTGIITRSDLIHHQDELEAEGAAGH